jgi:hypothetical protein
MVFTVLIHIVLCPFSHISISNATSPSVLVQDVSKTIILRIVLSALFATSGFTAPPANAVTIEEFLKLLGVLGRYADDIDRTFSPKNQQNVSPQTEPDLPQTTEQELDSTTDWSVE